MTVIRGVIVPDVAPERPQRGYVVGVGPDCHEIEVGQEVLFEKWDGVYFEVNRVKYLRIPEDGIFCVIDRGKGDAPIWLGLPGPYANKDRWRIT